MQISVFQLGSSGRGDYCAKKCEKCSDLNGRDSGVFVAYLAKEIEHISTSSTVGPSLTGRTNQAYNQWLL